jgi:lipoprotein-anchoring transpeptidase ErfK/SrfK
MDAMLQAHPEIAKKLPAYISRIIATVGTTPMQYLVVDTSNQKLSLVDHGAISVTFPVSTSKFGIGNRENSLMTPQGIHRIVEKYGHDAPVGRVFRDRIDTGEDWPIGQPGENLILTRILRLEGLENGINRGQGIDSYERYIYIHGTNNEHNIGAPASHGCVCMTNRDVITLFDTVSEGTIVIID